MHRCTSAAETESIIDRYTPRETSIELPESRLREDGYFMIEGIVGLPDKYRKYKIITQSYFFNISKTNFNSLSFSLIKK